MLHLRDGLSFEPLHIDKERWLWERGFLIHTIKGKRLPLADLAAASESPKLAYGVCPQARLRRPVRAAAAQEGAAPQP